MITRNFGEDSNCIFEDSGNLEEKLFVSYDTELKRINNIECHPKEPHINHTRKNCCLKDDQIEFYVKQPKNMWTKRKTSFF